MGIAVLYSMTAMLCGTDLLPGRRLTCQRKGSCKSLRGRKVQMPARLAGMAHANMMKMAKGSKSQDAKAHLSLPMRQ